MRKVRLRQDAIKALPYEGSDNAQCIYWDEALPSFGLRVYPTGRRTYVCLYRVQGRKRLATLGRADVLTLNQARKKARAYLGQVASGEDPQAAADAAHASGTVKELVATYLEEHARPKKKSWKDDESYLRRLLIPKLGTRLVASVTTAEIASIHSEVGREHPYAANRFLEVVRKMFNLARTWKKLPADAPNPADGIVEFPERKRRRYVTTEEMPHLAAAINAEENVYARHALWLLLLLGVRRSELLRAKWSDIDWDQRTLSIGETKNGEPILAPLSHAAVAQLRAIPRMDGNPYIICGREPGEHLSDLKSAWKRVRKASGLEDVRMHDLRRTVGSWLVRSGASLHLVGAVLNHKDPKTTAGYAYFQTQDRQRALDRHGKNVVAVAARGGPHTIAPNRPVTHRFERKQLFELVWSEPISQLAGRYGVSDSGLAKACRRADIPLPGRGYWAKLRSGIHVDMPCLPAPERSAEVISIRASARAPRLNELAGHSMSIVRAEAATASDAA